MFFDINHLSLKENLSNHLTRFCSAAVQFNCSVKKAREFLPGRVCELSIYEGIPTEIRRWLIKLCYDINQKRDKRSNLDFSLDHLPSELVEFSFPSIRQQRIACISESKFPGPKAPAERLVQWVLDHYDFPRLEERLLYNIENIDKKGFGLAARRIGLKFGLIEGIRSRPPLIINQIKGRYILECYHGYGRYSERTGQLEILDENLSVFEKESEVFGFSQCVKAIQEAESSNGIPSRTRFKTDGTVSATVFNEKIKFHLKPEILTALISFLKDYLVEDYSLCRIEMQ